MNISLVSPLLVIAALTATVCFHKSKLDVATVGIHGPTNSITTSSSIRVRKMQSESTLEEETEVDDLFMEWVDEIQEEPIEEEPVIESTPEEEEEPQDDLFLEWQVKDENQDKPIEEEKPIIETYEEDTVIEEVNVDSVVPEYSEEIQPEKESQEEESEDELAEDTMNEESGTDSIEEESNEEYQQPGAPQEGTIDEVNTESATPELNEEIQELDEEFQPQDESTEETTIEAYDEAIEEPNTESATSETYEELDDESKEVHVETFGENNEDPTTESAPSEFNEGFQPDDESYEDITDEAKIEKEMNSEVSEQTETGKPNEDAFEAEYIEDFQPDEPQEETAEEVIVETNDKIIEEPNTDSAEESIEAEDEEPNPEWSVSESTEELQPAETQGDLLIYTIAETNEDVSTESGIAESNEEFQEETDDLVEQTSSNGLEYNDGQEDTTNERIVDFVIAGFPKCGNSFLSKVLNIPETYTGYPTEVDPSGEREVHDLEKSQSEKHIKKFINRYDLSKHPNYFNDKYKYHRIYNEEKVINGFKAPMLVEHTDGLQNLFNIVPDVDFVMTTRHPVLWFQSFWNFRARDGRNMPSPLDLIGNCDSGCDPDDPGCEIGAFSMKAFSVCTDAAKFHHYLSRLQFTSMTPDEVTFLGHGLRHSTFDFTGRMFLVESSQMSDENPARMDRFRSELTDFLGLKPDTLSSFYNIKDKYDADKKSPEYLVKRYKNMNKTSKMSLEKRLEDVDMTENMDTELVELILSDAVETLDICEEKYAPLREILVDIGSNAATWIEDYLLESPRVVVANKDYFLQLIGLWKLDPCDEDHESVTRARERGLLQWEGY